MSPITLYARSDLLACGAVPGCDQEHRRPVDERTGHAVPVWGLTCPAHEAYYRGDGKPKILKYDLDAKTRTVIGQSRVADASPMFSSTPDTLPLTPDEERTNSVRSERGAQQIQMIQALAALRATGIEVPPEALWLLERELPAGVLKGTVVCADGHDNQAGTKFCAECGISMAAKGAISPAPEAPPGEPVVDLGRLHPQTLKKMLRARGLDDKGSKDALIGRLKAA